MKINSKWLIIQGVKKKLSNVEKVTNIQIVTHPYLGRLSKNVLEVWHDDIANLVRYRK